jgi:hypothetical protein
MKEERRRRRKRRKKTIILGVGDGRRTRQDFLSSKNISRKISLSSLSFCDRIGAEPKKSSQSKRTFLYLRQNTNCIGHTLRRVWGRKRREREKETRASSYLLHGERKRVFSSCHPSSLKEEI